MSVEPRSDLHMLSGANAIATICERGAAGRRRILLDVGNPTNAIQRMLDDARPCQACLDVAVLMASGGMLEVHR